MIGAMVAFSVITALAGREHRLAAARDRHRRRAGRGSGLHGRRLHAGARRLPAAAHGAAARAPHHRDRPVDHPAAPRDDHLDPQSDRVSADHHRDADTTSPTTRTARRSPTCRWRSSSRRSLMMAGLLALVYRTKLGIAMRATSQNQQVAGIDGHQHQHGDRADLRDRRRTRRDGGRDGRHVLRHRAVPDGLHPRPQGVLGGGAGRHRQPRAARCWAACCSA